jgi:transcriptional regulator with XRE-family HTH domain
MEDADYFIKVGENIARIRKRKKWSQVDLGAEAGIDSQNINRIEKGKANATVKTLKKIADALGCTVSDLVK